MHYFFYPSLCSSLSFSLGFFATSVTQANENTREYASFPVSIEEKREIFVLLGKGV